MIVEHPKKVPIIMRLNLMSHEHQGKSADLGKDDGDEHAKEGIWRDARGKDRQNLELVNLDCRDYGLGTLPMNELGRIG